MMEKQEEQIEAQAGWASLPRDVAWEIFRRLRHVDILRGAGLACASWRQLAADEPALWRSIDVAFDKDDDGEERPFLARLAMGRAAVDRSAGRCESFRGPADRHLLVYLADRAPSLRSLHVTSPWCLPDAYMDSVITKLPMLEQLVLTGGGILRISTLRALLKHCPHLKLLDAGNCCTDGRVSYRLWRKCRRTIKALHLPGNAFVHCWCRTCVQERRAKEQIASQPESLQGLEV